MGHGGAWFPVAAKWRAVAGASRRRPVVVANGAEGEPASHKDALLLARAPHLVLDGLALAASTLRAQQAIVYVPASSIPTVEAAVAERRAQRLDPIAIELAESPDTFIAGQESAVVNALGGRRGAVPSFVGLTTIRERGVGGRPTLVQNVETLAHVALVARFGADWFRSIGTPQNPGTMLLTVSRPGGPLVVEAALGSSLRAAAGIGEEDLARTRAFLLGGYGGAWVSPQVFGELPVPEKAARRAGATLGAGVIVPLPRDVCPLAEMADVVRYMEGQGAGQCGPCVHGLAELAETMDRLAYGGRGMDPTSTASSRLRPGGGEGCLPPSRRRCPVRAQRPRRVRRRGRLAPAPRPVPSDAGGARPPGGGPDGEEKIGEPGMSRWSLELVLDPVACDGRGVCAEMLPERIELDRWGYPVVDGAEIAPALFEHAVAPCGRVRSRPCTWWSAAC